jgi:hypothetical protein
MDLAESAMSGYGGLATQRAARLNREVELLIAANL